MNFIPTISKIFSIILVTILLNFVILFPTSLFDCTSFNICKDNHIVVGKNLDWFCKDAWLAVNKRNVTKKTFLLLPFTSQLTWTSKYGSITSISNSLGIPSGGMNEAGLMIEESWLNSTQYPEPDSRPLITEIQWIQYQLDNCSTIEEVIKTDETLCIKSYTGLSHYFVYDRTGKVAVIEFISGKMVAHVLDRNDVQVITNNTYASSENYLKNCNGFSNEQNIANSATGSLERFACATKKTKHYPQNINSDAVSYSFDILKAVSQQSTAWSVVYDITNRSIHYKTADNKNIRTINLSEFDFNCQSPVMIIDLHIDKTGNISPYLEPYTTSKHETLVNAIIKSWRENNFAIHITDAEVKKLIDYPMFCT